MQKHAILEKVLNNSKNEINFRIDEMISILNRYKLLLPKKDSLKVLNNPLIIKSDNNDNNVNIANNANNANYINNIKVKKMNKIDELEEYPINEFNYGKGNYFYEDKTGKYFYDYYKGRDINCPACIIGNSNSQRGFSPIICQHLDDD